MDAKVTDNKWIGKRTIRPDGADKVTAKCPQVPAMATVATAIQDAVGLRLDDLPMSPPKVLAALDKNS